MFRSYSNEKNKKVQEKDTKKREMAGTISQAFTGP
jgi:hypothetical protein